MNTPETILKNSGLKKTKATPFSLIVIAICMLVFATGCQKRVKIKIDTDPKTQATDTSSVINESSSDSASETSEDSTDTGEGTETGTEPDTGVSDTVTSSKIDIPTDHEVDTGTGFEIDTVTETEIIQTAQGDINIIIQNNTPTPRYIDAPLGRWHILDIKDANGNPVHFFDPVCPLRACTEMSPQENCNFSCDITTGVYFIGAGESLRFEWDGYIRQIVNNYCADGGACVGKIPAPVGEYRLQVRTWLGYECILENDCPNLEGFQIVANARASGKKVISEVSFLVAAQKDVILQIED